jgi:hypothetical protein
MTSRRGYYLYTFAYAPDRRGQSSAVAAWGIYVVRPDGSGFRRVAATPMMELLGISLARSPDSRRIAFSDVPAPGGRSFEDGPARVDAAPPWGRDGSSSLEREHPSP